MTSINKKFFFLADKANNFSPEQSSSYGIFYCAHIGTSMRPTLSEYDLLEIEPYQMLNPKVGEVILFQTPHSKEIIIHRIVKNTPNGFKTKGDNCGIIDSWTLQKKHIYGRVVAAQKGKKRRDILTGVVGSMTRAPNSIKLKINKLTTILLRPVYRSLCTGGLLRWLFPVRLTLQVATYRSGAGDFHKLILGKRVIGSYDELLLQWQIKRPYRLFVDENSLPTPR